jgi:hypothetical protein
MDESWPDILESAAANLSHDLNRGRPRRIQYPASAPQPQSRSPARHNSGAEARMLLERELAAISARPIYDKPAPLPQPQHEARSQWRAISGQRNSPPLPDHVDDRQVSQQKPVRAGSLMAALGAATPTPLASELLASELEESTTEQTVEGATRQTLLPKWLPPRRAIAISVVAAIAGLAVCALLSRGGAGVNTSPAGEAAPAANFSGILVDIPLPTRRKSPPPTRQVGF